MRTTPTKAKPSGAVPEVPETSRFASPKSILRPATSPEQLWDWFWEPEGEVASASASAAERYSEGYSETDRLSAIRSSMGPNEDLVATIVDHFTKIMKNNSSLSDVEVVTLTKTASMLQAANDRATAVKNKRLSSQVPDDDPLLAGSSRSSMVTRARRQGMLSFIILWALPTACTMWYAAAIFFPVDAQAAAPALLWTPGASVWANGTVSCCPKPALCSEGWAQFWLLVAARLSAFAMYPSMLLVFLSKCQAALRFLSRTFVAELLPLSHFHDMHTFHGILFASLALLHTVAHLVRWGLRGEIDPFLGHMTGASGTIGIVLMLAVTGSMLLPRLLRCPKLGRLTALGKTPFELRFNIHYCFIPLAVALFIHAERLLTLTLVATCAWMSDYAYQVVFRTFRLDVVEFTNLTDGGVQDR